jgi:GWxTD domain-containing protein
MRGTKLTIIILFAIGNTAGLFGQTKISNLDFQYIYNPENDPIGDIKCAKSDSVATILLKVDKPLDSLKKYTLSYSLVNSLEEEIEKRVVLSSISAYFQYEDQLASYYGFNANVHDAKYIVVWLSDTVRRVRYPIFKHIEYKETAEDIILYQKAFNAPVISDYIKENTSLRLGTIDGKNQDINIRYYDHHFLPAKPPMAAVPDSTGIKLSHDKLYQLTTNDTINFVDKGLYFIYPDGADYGESILVTDDQYPKVADFDGLIEALRYLATDEEYLKMTTSFNKKELFDKFWLNNTKSEEKALDAIREYYSRVLEANTLFTNYKEGWKTDKGMIYIIYGPPSRVFIKDNSEMWIYEKSFELPRVAFNFSLIATAFSDEHFVLNRNTEYQNLWFRTVDLWRSGKKEY